MATWCSNFTSEYITKRIESKGTKSYVYTHVYNSIIHSSLTYKQPKCPMTDEWVKKM